MEIPKEIREHIARARAYLQDGAIVKALESVSIALRSMSSLSHVPSGKSVDNLINSTLQELAQHPHMQALLQHYPSEKSPLNYQRGKEGVLATVLQEFAKMLQTDHIKPNDENLQNQRLNELLNKAQEAYFNGELGTGTSYLKRAAAEFDSDAKALNQIATILAEAEQCLLAAKIFQMAVQNAPKDLENYTLAINNFIFAKDYAGAENIFKLALRQFGGHPRTHGRMSLLYALWGKQEEAKAFADMALEADATEQCALKTLQMLNEQVEED